MSTFPLQHGFEKSLCAEAVAQVAGLNELYKKRTLAQVFSCEFCKISKNTFSYRTLSVILTAAKLGIVDSNENLLEGIVITSLM